ncbi:MAG: tRNA (adenosine(37)-N6)-threonylcarbamoyltransferase complex dimerization subunit type 1 TsaB [Spirochaetaceae bacterium]|nr:tRNA (adenosine(37)-N6)-threonylcarbamoyltransferase complex dimerization subunit type 1 TsaB [Spirochaetaceae bacterium]
MNILAIDTAGELLSVGISTEAGVFSFDADAGTRHSELLFDAVDALTKLARIEREAFDIFVCMKGPGSFTGLRIGFSAVKGMALALGKPFLSVPTLDCMARPFAPCPYLCVPLLDAKQRRFFSALYRKGQRLSGYFDCGAEELAGHIAGSLRETANPAERTVLLTGNGADPVRQALSCLLPDALVVTELPCGSRALRLLQYAKETYILKFMGDTRVSAPLYIRKSI